MGLFEVAIAVIFAREVLEGTIIIGQYRTVIKKSDQFAGDEKKQAEANKAVTHSALIASGIALLVCIATAVPLAIASKDMDDKVADIIEGVSKVVAAICILQLSTKIPKWLGMYESKAKIGDHDLDGLSMRSIKFNVAWNIWREVAECGVFLIPFFLGDGAEAIPLSGAIGIVIGLAGGIGVYYASNNLENKFWLTVFCSSLLGMLSVGLFVGGCHEFEEVWGETKKVWSIDGDFWSHKKFPMVILKPFGYSSSRTVLQICCFWSWLALLIAAHYYKYTKATKENIEYVKKPINDEEDNNA